MPAQKGKSGLGQKYGTGFNKTVNEHKDTPVKFGGADRLPPGIENGVAQLVDCKFDVYKEGDNKGEYFYHERAVVVLPEVHNGVKVIGRQFSKTEPVCDTTKGTRKSQSEHVAWVMNELKKLGWEPPKDRDITAEDLEGAAEALRQSKPYMKFRTWVGTKSEIVNENGKWYVVTGNKKEGPYLSEQALKVAKPFAGAEPMVNEDWGGATDHVMQQQDGLTDSTPATTDEEGTADAAPESTGEEADLDALATEADGDDGDAAATQLLTLAKEVGIEEDEVKGADNWAAVAELIKAKQSGDSATNGFTPEAKGIVFYKPTGNDPRTKKPYKKAFEHEVLTVNEDARTVTLKDMDTKKTVIGANKKALAVSFDEVTSEG